nr:FAD-dependent oxidoreductase [bacterium]
MKQKKVVILGGGFGGIACAKKLDADYPGFEVTLIDQSPYHIIHSNLYEVATAPEELSDLRKLKQTVALAYTKIFTDTRVIVKQGKVISIDAEKQTVELEHGSVLYDYLVAALGARPNYYGIAGADQFSIPLQTAGDALRIRDRIEFAVQAHRLDTQKDVVRIMVAGGGVAGVEVAAELQGMLDFIAWKNNYPRKKIETVVIEGTGQMLPGFETKVAETIANRLEKFGVKILTRRMIAGVESNMVTFSNGERMEHDCLIWTAGVKAVPLPLKKPVLTAKGDRVEVDEYFRVNGHANIFTIGDQSCHHAKDGAPLPGTASQAIDQGVYIAGALSAFAKNKTPATHTCKVFPYIIPLGGKWAIYKSSRMYIKGYLAYFI